MRNKRGYLILLFLFICVNMCFYVSAAENEKDQSDILQEEIKNKILGEVDFSEINQNLKLLFPDEKICFQDIVETLMQGNLQETGIKILSYVKDQISYEFRANKTNLVHILLLQSQQRYLQIFQMHCKINKWGRLVFIFYICF